MNDNNNNSEFKRIQSKADIVEIINSYVKLENHGKNFFGICPFHDDHSPSMSVSKDKQIYKCFVCGATGNVFTFVENYLGVSFLEAVKIVADKIGENFVIHKSKTNTANSKYFEIMNLTTLFYENNLRTPIGKEARDYLVARGLDEKLQKDFSIGLAPKDNDMLYKLLKKKNINDKDMETLGLINNGDSGPYDLFRNRIIFPLKSPDGQVNGFSGRIYNETSNSKYINTKETVIFKKRENLYNYNLASPEARREKYIIVCEGFMDAIRIYSIGLKNVVATMGTALAKEQVDLLKRLNVKVILIMDNDKAGEMATLSIGEILLKENIDVGVVRLTGKKDPDEYILEYGPAAFKDNVKSPMSFIDFVFRTLRKDKDLTNPVDLTNYINSVIGIVSVCPDSLLVETCINKLSEEFHLDKDLLRDRVKSNEKIENVQVTKNESVREEEKPKGRKTKFERAMEAMVYYMMNDTECMKLFVKSRIDLPKSKYRLVANNLLYYFELNREIDFADYLTFSESYKDVSPVVKEILANVKITSFKLEDMKAALEIVKKVIDEERIQAIKKEISAELDVSRRKKLFEEILEIKRGCVNINEEE